MNEIIQLGHNDFVAFCESTPSLRKSSREYLYDHDIRLYESYNLILKYIFPGADILSLGGGTCFIEMAIANTLDVRVTTFDFRKSYEKNIDSYSKYDIKFIEGNFLSDLPKIDRKYDLIIMSEFVEHIPISLSEQLSMVRPLLKEKGLLFLSTPNFSNLYNILTLAIGKKNIIASDKLLFQNVCESYQHVHRREYISSEIEDAMTEQKFFIVRKEFCEGSSRRTLRMKLLSPIKLLAKRLYPYCIFIGKLG
jgi:2-polyprenyl-3-methyl-5-hydroxy-6-metoxy-1,4-benzoquinol methylase